MKTVGICTKIMVVVGGTSSKIALAAATNRLEAYLAVNPPKDVLLFSDGSRLRTADEWLEKARPAVVEFFDENVYGKMHPRLDKAAAELWTANDTVGAAMDARNAVARDRAEERATGSTPELRKVVANLLVKAAKRVNAVYEIDPENEKTAKAIGDVATIVEQFRRVASEAKRRKGGDEPEPAPEPAASAS